jgi:phosphoribosylformylglycinamidine cyclo-ligase
MYQVFNCGYRMELYAPEAIASEIIAISQSFAVEAQVVGRVESGSGSRLTISSDKGIFEY